MGEPERPPDPGHVVPLPLHRLRGVREEPGGEQDVPHAGVPLRQGRQLHDGQVRVGDGGQLDDSHDGGRLPLRSHVRVERRLLPLSARRAGAMMEATPLPVLEAYTCRIEYTLGLDHWYSYQSGEQTGNT